MPDRPLSSGGEHESDTPLAYDATRSTLESLLNTLPVSVLIKDRDTRRLFANQSYLNVRGLSLDELVGMRNEDLHPPEMARQITEDDERVMRERAPLRNFEKTVDADGVGAVDGGRRRVVTIYGRECLAHCVTRL